MTPWTPWQVQNAFQHWICRVDFGRWKLTHSTEKKQHFVLMKAYFNLMLCHLDYAMPLQLSSGLWIEY